MPARVGPTMLTPGAMEWHAEQPGGVELNATRPSSIGSLDAALAAGAPTLAPGTALPFTRMGRGGQPCVSILLTQPRKAIRAVMSASLSFSVGMSRRYRSSE